MNRNADRDGQTMVSCEVCGEAVPMKIGQLAPDAKPVHPRCR